MQIQIDRERKELKSHGSFSYPVHISHEVLSNYERGQFAWHWHPEIELTLFIKGKMKYQINDTIYTVHAGDALFCNVNALHFGQMIDQVDCEYISITFLPKMIYGFEGSLIQNSFVEPLIQDSTFASFWFNPMEESHMSVIQALSRIHDIFVAKPELMELEVSLLLQYIWKALFLIRKPALESTELVARKNRERIKTLLEYMHAHYSEPITLEDISLSVNLCKSECCRFFKKYMKKTMFEYLIEYRISKSLSLLAKDDHSITEVADLCGFSNPCYFGKLFKEQMNMTPREYRKKMLASSDRQP